MTVRYNKQPSGKTIVEAHVTFPSYVRWTDPVELDYRRPFNVSVSGTFDSSIVTLQRSFDDGVVWHDVWTTTEADELIVDTVEPGTLWRCGLRVGDTNMATDLKIRISQ